MRLESSTGRKGIADANDDAFQPLNHLEMFARTGTDGAHRASLYKQR